jgi:hypothetical protein
MWFQDYRTATDAQCAFSLNEIILSLPDIEAGLKRLLLLPHIRLDYALRLRAQNSKMGLYLAARNS